MPVMHERCAHVPSRTLEKNRVDVPRGFSLNAQGDLCAPLFNAHSTPGSPSKSESTLHGKYRRPVCESLCTELTRAEAIPEKMLTDPETKPARSRCHVPPISAVGRNLAASVCDQHALRRTRVPELTETVFRVHRAPLVPKPIQPETDYCRDLNGCTRARSLSPHPRAPETSPPRVDGRRPRRGERKHCENNQRRKTPSRKKYEEDTPNSADTSPSESSNSPPSPYRQSPRTDLRHITAVVEVEKYRRLSSSRVGARRFWGPSPYGGARSFLRPQSWHLLMRRSHLFVRRDRTHNVALGHRALHAKSVAPCARGTWDFALLGARRPTRSCHLATELGGGRSEKYSPRSSLVSSQGVASPPLPNGCCRELLGPSLHREQGTAPDVLRTEKGKASQRSDRHCHFPSAPGGTRGDYKVQGPHEDVVQESP